MKKILRLESINKKIRVILYTLLFLILFACNNHKGSKLYNMIDKYMGNDKVLSIACDKNNNVAISVFYDSTKSFLDDLDIDFNKLQEKLSDDMIVTDKNGMAEATIEIYDNNNQYKYKISLNYPYFVIIQDANLIEDDIKELKLGASNK